MREAPAVRHLLRALMELAPDAFVVGGAVRDSLLGKQSPLDLDVAVPGDGYDLARQLATVYGKGATFVPLDRERGTGRIVLHDTAAATLDIASFKGLTLREDLFGRDFTINALALSVPDFLSGASAMLIDPTGGLEDLRAGVIRACDETAFQADPLRILRAFRFKACFGFRVHPETRELMGASIPDMVRVSPERIRDELFAIFSADGTGPALDEMATMGVLFAVFPEIGPMKGCQQNRYHHLDVWDHSLEAIRGFHEIVGNLEALPGTLGREVEDYLKEEPVPARSKAALLRLALLFHDAGKPQTRTLDQEGNIRFFGHEKISRDLFESAANRLKLARREIALIGEWIGGHMRMMVFTGASLTARAAFRLRRTYGRDLTGLVLLFLADLAASRGPARDPEAFQLALGRCAQTLQDVFAEAQLPAKPLLNGRDIMERFGVAPGPALGALIRKIEELQGIGEICSKDDALKAVSRLLEEGLAEEEAEKPKAR